jgi:NADH-ubiquinone oxidoreductase chain 6
MNSTLYLIYETFTNGYIPNVLDIISILAILSAIFVILNKNPIISVLCLIGLFASISCYLIIIGLSFIGLSYLIVYIGAVSILFLFILMLINIRISELQSNTSNSIALCIIIAILFNSSLFQVLPYDIAILNNSNGAFSYINNSLYGTSESVGAAVIQNNNFFNIISTTADNNNIFFVTSKI